MFRVDTINKTLIKLKPTNFSELGLRERFDIQEWIEKSPAILGNDLLVIGKEVVLASGKRLDLLCVNKSAALVIVELKRDDSGSSVEWQAIKYASYCSKLFPDEIFKLYAAYLKESEFDAAKKNEEFIDADIELLNEKQHIILVSKEFNSEVISAVLWLREYGIDIQCTRLAPFVDSDGELFIKPETIIPLPEAKDYIERREIKHRAIASTQEDWTGSWFVNVGECKYRTWDDNRQFGFISAGQGKVYSSALNRLAVGDKIYAYMKGCGYVGFGEVTKPAVMIRDFLTDSNVPLLSAGLKAEHPNANSDNEELSEWVVGVRWIKSLPREQAKTFSGIFANQNVVCKLRHEQTLKFVQSEFGQ
ncbi:MmcB family DNA repair protein [Atlantibacter hermannii]|uniref:MmcB family DNA repair protein n=1 Tax=Atlantibacter hermannii TaxID=565 RepID=UPI00289952C9|nr:MmcB family DNA repair protein [Atlantibacter hermannii]